jgi:hypothetical protein
VAVVTVTVRHQAVDEDGRPGSGAGVFATPLTGGFGVRCACGWSSWNEMRDGARQSLAKHILRRARARAGRERVGADRA